MRLIRKASNLKGVISDNAVLAFASGIQIVVCFLAIQRKGFLPWYLCLLYTAASLAVYTWLLFKSRQVKGRIPTILPKIACFLGCIEIFVWDDH